jgi:uncharacterized protein YbjT (DUF2867 family)
MTAKKIILLGASGLVGGAASAAIAKAGHELHLISRRPLPDAPPQAKVHVAPTEGWADLIAKMQADCVISCLGTTMRIAGSKAAFARVDLDLVLSAAACAKQGGAKHFMMVSSSHANAASSNFYLQTKGKAEAGILALGFERTDIFRPGLLKGNRAGPLRYAERIGLMLSPVADMLLFGPLSEYRSIHADIVGGAIAKLVTNNVPGHFIHGNDAMHALAS